MTFKSQLYIPNKMEYLRGHKRSAVDCIICSILQKDPVVSNLLVFENETVACSVNLYPYNAGHLFIFPVRHIVDPRELTEKEQAEMNKLRNFAITQLEEIYQPNGFNIGFNIGYASGASIDHLHQHIVPRYERELGFVDIISGSKIIIEDPNITLEKLRENFKKYE
jgi:ATP adenylyltransferase